MLIITLTITAITIGVVVHAESPVNSIVKNIQNIFEKTHSYDLPELIMINIQDSSADYLRWMQENIG